MALVPFLNYLQGKLDNYASCKCENALLTISRAKNVFEATSSEESEVRCNGYH